MGDDVKSDAADQGAGAPAAPETAQDTSGGDHVEGDKVVNEAPENGES